MSREVKRARRRFCVNFKLHCVHQYENTKSYRQTAKANKVSRSTLRGWVKYKTFLENVCNRSNYNFTNRFIY